MRTALNIFSIMLLNIVICFGAEARQVWLGFASQGQGGGIMGHGFVVVSEDTATLFFSDTYSYGVEKTSSENLIAKAKSSMGLGLKFKQEKLSFQQVYGYYTTGENRSLLLVELSLSEEEINQLVNRLEKDAEDSRFAEHERYNILNNNCITYPLKIINQIVPENKRIYLSQMMDYNFPSRSFLKDPSFATLARIPLYLMRHLQKQPIATGVTQTFQSEIQRQGNILQDISENKLQELSDCLGWDETFGAIFLDSLLLKRNNPDASVDDLKLLMTAPGCNGSSTKWKEFLTAYNDLIPLGNTRLKLRIYNLKKDINP